MTEPIVKHTVSTDALDTLGTIIGPDEKRDAIHLAVFPAVAGTDLRPGQHVILEDGVALPVPRGEGFGIVDPFLLVKVKAGWRFWLVVYPREITSLRHVWEHPSFPSSIDRVVVTEPAGFHYPDLSTHPDPVEREAAERAAVAEKRVAAETWLRDYAGDMGFDFDDMLVGAENAASWGNDYIVIHDSDASGPIPEEFWDKFEDYTGESVRFDKRETSFSCSC